jgi:alkyl sulfatase BDS1-like metallo-beta-lactamase superfamily hydrolase
MKGIQVNTRMTHCALVWIALLAAFSIAVACTQHAAPPMLVSEAASPKPASAATVAANAAVLRELPFQDKQDFQDAMRGFIAPLPNNGAITSDDGRAVWDLSRFQFAKDQPAPATVNPSLWRQLQLLSIGGLFEVTPRIYQVRGGDLSNITFIEGKTGIIVMDPCISVETAKAGLDLYHKHRGNRPVVAVVYTHSHIDHFGGVRGVLDEKDVKAGKVRIIAPEHFVEEAVSENVVAGNHMQRRASYMFGKLISPGPVGMLGAGLGLTTPNGMSTLIEPTDVITKTGQTLTIDGLTFEFLLAPGSEAPAEMHFYVPELRALTAAENANHTLHNLYTLRGAKVRDARGWASYLDQTIERWGDQAEVLYGPHHWPTWGQARIVDHLKKQRDMYKYLNDQTLRLANHGYNMVEAAEMINPPRELGQHWANRGTYGSVSHDVKAVWTYYLGYLDGNPARLEPLPPIDAGKKYVEYMGGASAVIQKARKDYEAGNYRWVAQVLDQVVSADPSNQEAKNLLADALEQMGYQAESGPWRNFYLTGAKELREGVKKLPVPRTTRADIIRSMPIEMLFDYLAVRLNGPKSDGKNISINLNLPDSKQQYALVLENAVLHTSKPVKQPDAILTIARASLNDIILGQATLAEKLESGNVKVEGNKAHLDTLLSLLDTFEFWWNVSTPNAPPAKK